MGYEGAWMYATLYSWWFYAECLWWFHADGRRTTGALRDRARQEDDVYIDNAFATHPRFAVA